MIRAATGLVRPGRTARTSFSFVRFTVRSRTRARSIVFVVVLFLHNFGGEPALLRAHSNHRRRRRRRSTSSSLSVFILDSCVPPRAIVPRRAQRSTRRREQRLHGSAKKVTKELVKRRTVFRFLIKRVVTLSLSLYSNQSTGQLNAGIYLCDVLVKRQEVFMAYVDVFGTHHFSNRVHR